MRSPGMADVANQLGIVGLGAMGASLALRARDCGYEVVGTDLDGVPANLAEAGVQAAGDAAALVESLAAPRIVLLSVPAGRAVDVVADRLAEAMEPGDIIIDGGNSYWGDSKRRFERYSGRGIHFLDCGISGGPDGAREAPCFMIGGPRKAVAQVEPILRKLAGPSGFVHAGESGAGHYAKLVHNGIEFGMLQAIGEGVALLEGFPQELAIGDTLECWNRGSVVRSFLVELMARAYKEDPAMTKPSAYVEDTGEVNWLVGDAMNLDVPAPVITLSVMELLKSRDETGIATKAITQMRHEFGRHPYDRDPVIARTRRTGRVGPLFRFEEDPQ